ncbi:hypothetical protein GCM10007887_19920 [Methylobacterium haplocladii]|uniref:Uncharacterized protein n=1 Tax=Methylobacterium haplocladii TaxID=1176176 RepID=A0A512IQR0_9HYPH|nr:hypothetical protein MHA02_24420 [Methylobacterium haplocladii]GLS59326.1 hypothetical protein GCM10007887_19920 [Methylobacterium haplocladii]
MKTGTGTNTGGGAARRGRSAAEAAVVRSAIAAPAKRSFFITMCPSPGINVRTRYGKARFGNYGLQATVLPEAAGRRRFAAFSGTCARVA